MLRISWTEKRTNDSVRMEIGIEKDVSLHQEAARRKLGYFGHIMRSNGLEKELMLACGEGRRRRGRPRMKWMDEILERTGKGLEELRESTRDRRSWRGYIRSVAMARRADSTR